MLTTGEDRLPGRAAFDPTGRTLYAAFGEGQIQIWDLEKLDTPDAMTPLTVAGARDCFRDLYVGPAGRHLLIHNENDTIYVLRLNQAQAAEQN